MKREPDNFFETKGGTFALWTDVLAGPLLWFLNQSLNFVLTPWACRTQQVEVLHVIAFTCLVGTLLAGASARRHWRWAEERLGEVRAHSLVRGRFLAQLGVLGSVLFALVIIAMAVPNFLIDPCVR